MDTKEARKPAARTSSIEEETVKKPSKPQHAYFAVRQCDFLKGPAIFFAWEDCSFYVDQNDDVEYQGFDLILDAVEWIHERAESVPPYPPLPMSPMNYHMRPPMMAKTPPKTAAGVGVDVTFDETASPPRSKAMTLTAEIAKTTAPKPTSRKRKRPTVNTDTVWEEQFQEMTRYKLEHGDCEIPSSTASPHLKKWIKRNREAFAKMKKVGKGDNSLQAQRLAKLTELGFNFTLKKPYPTWEERVEQYREYKTKHGKEPVKYSGDGLGNWVTLQRQRYRQLKKGEPSRLKQEKADQLTREGFTWDTGIKIAKFVHPRRSWDESYADLIAYKEKIGHTDVPHLYPRLGHWVHEQRRIHQKFSNGTGKPMAPERLAKLKHIDFVFSSKEFRRGSGKKHDRYPPKKERQSSSETEVEEGDE